MAKMEGSGGKGERGVRPAKEEKTTSHTCLGSHAPSPPPTQSPSSQQPKPAPSSITTII